MSFKMENRSVKTTRLNDMRLLRQRVPNGHLTDKTWTPSVTSFLSMSIRWSSRTKPIPQGLRRLSGQVTEGTGSQPCPSFGKPKDG